MVNDIYNPFGDVRPETMNQPLPQEVAPQLMVKPTQYQEPTKTAMAYEQPNMPKVPLPADIQKMIQEMTKEEAKQEEVKVEEPQEIPAGTVQSSRELSIAPEASPVPVAETQPTIIPTTAPVTQAFGNKSRIESYSGGVNLGTDFAVAKGTPLAVPEGEWKVVSAYSGAKEGVRGANQGSGNMVTVQNTKTGEKLGYEHLSGVNVKAGDTVKGGTVVGASGNTGNSTGAHASIPYQNAQGKYQDVLKSPYANSVMAQSQPTQKNIVNTPDIKSLIKKYFPKEEWQRAYNVMMGESSGNVGAIGDQQPINGVLAPSYGLFQIRGLPGRPEKEQLLNPEFNVKYAADMWRNEGWRPWSAARKLGYVQ